MQGGGCAGLYYIVPSLHVFDAAEQVHVARRVLFDNVLYVVWL